MGISGYQWFSWFPSGKLSQFAIGNCPVEIVDLPINSMVVFHSYVCLPEGMGIVCWYVYQCIWFIVYDTIGGTIWS